MDHPGRDENTDALWGHCLGVYVTRQDTGKRSAAEVSPIKANPRDFQTRWEYKTPLRRWSLN